MRHTVCDRNGTIKVVMILPLALTASLLLGLVPTSHSAELTIQMVLADPEPYHMKVVTLSGISHQVQILRDPPNSQPSMDFQCYFVHPPFTFVLSDPTGFLQITVRGRLPCVSQESSAEPPDVSEGQKVVVQVQITVTSVYHEGVSTRAVEAHAVGIHRFDE